MAEYKSDTYTAQETAGNKSASMIATAHLVSGKSQFLQAEVTIPAGTSANDTILAAFLPAGVSVIPGLITITTAVECGSNSFNIGTADAPDGIATGATAETVGTANLGAAGVVGSYSNNTSQALVITLSDALTEGGKFFLNIPLVNSN